MLLPIIVYYAMHSDFLNCGLNRFLAFFFRVFSLFFFWLVAIVMQFLRFKLLHSNSTRLSFFYNNYSVFATLNFITCARRVDRWQFLTLTRILSTLLSIYVSFDCLGLFSLRNDLLIVFVR